MMTRTELIEKPCSQVEYPSTYRVLSEDELDQVSGGLPPLVLAGIALGFGAAAIHTWFVVRYHLK